MAAQSYSTAAKFIHWAIALALAFQLGLGWQLEYIPKGPLQFAAYQMHKSVGITILLLTLARIAIRIVRRPPPLMADSPWALRAAKLVHWMLYAAMLIGPVTGWILVSTARVKVPTLLFGTFSWPHLPVPPSWHEPAEGAHGFVARLLLALFFLHFLGALRHQFIKDENILGRMLPFMKAAPIGRAKGALIGFLSLVALWAAHGAGWQYPFARPAASLVLPAALEAPTPAAPAPATGRTTVATAPAAANEIAEPLADWKVQAGGRLGFTANWAGSAVEGHFGHWQAAIRFSPDQPEKTVIRVNVDLASVDTADSQRDESLRGADFFDISAHPHAVFTASGIRPLGGDRFEARGMLDLHGARRPARLRFALKLDGDEAHVRGTTSLDRTAFGVGSGGWAATDQIAAAVGVAFEFTAKRKQAR